MFLAKPRGRKERQQKDPLCDSASWRATAFRISVDSVSGVSREGSEARDWSLSAIAVTKNYGSLRVSKADGRFPYTDSSEMFEQHKTELGFDARRLFLSILAAVLLLAIAGVISTLNGESDHFFAWAFGLAMAVSIVRQLLRDARRTKDIREFALGLGFTHLDAALPTSFPLHRTSSSRARSISGACASEINRREILFFDCELGHGKGRF